MLAQEGAKQELVSTDYGEKYLLHIECFPGKSRF